MSIRWPIVALGMAVFAFAGCGGPTYRSGPPAPVEQGGVIPLQSRADPPPDEIGSYSRAYPGSYPGAPEIRAATPPPQGPITGSTVDRGSERVGTRPAPVESRDPTEVAIYAPPALPGSAQSRPSRAVQSLMARAEQQTRAGDYTNAAASLERALRIDSKDAGLWNRLAHVRFQQSRHQVAEELAAKSNALARAADFDLRRDNWLLIAKARSAAGDRSGASEAQRHAAQLEAR
jgi:tetratricopeptide (TPR) repeat protein